MIVVVWCYWFYCLAICGCGKLPSTAKCRQVRRETICYRGHCQKNMTQNCQKKYDTNLPEKYDTKWWDNYDTKLIEKYDTNLAEKNMTGNCQKYLYKILRKIWHKITQQMWQSDDDLGADVDDDDDLNDVLSERGGWGGFWAQMVGLGMCTCDQTAIDWAAKCKMQNVIHLQKEKGKSALTVCARHTWAWNKLLVYTCVDHCKIQYLCNALKNSFKLGRIMHSHAVQIMHLGTGLGAGAPCTPWRRIPNYAIISSRKFSGTTVQNKRNNNHWVFRNQKLPSVGLEIFKSFSFFTLKRPRFAGERKIILNFSSERNFCGVRWQQSIRSKWQVCNCVRIR